jgi:hypothetical protein
MSTTVRERKTPSLFGDDAGQSGDRVLFLNKDRLLQVIGEWKGAESLATLRQKVWDLEGNLRSVKHDRIGVLNIDGNGSTVKVGRNQLFQELMQITEAQTIDRARYYSERLEKGISEVRTSKVNDINLNRWKEYEDVRTDSLWIIDKRDSSGVHTAGYWGNFIPQIPNQMLRRYTKKGEWVLDTFVGCGTTLIESQRLGRNGVGIELQERVAEKARNLIAAEPNERGVVSEVVTGDSTRIDFREILDRLGQKGVQLLIMHPPYFDIIKFSNDARDLSNAPSVDAFLQMMNEVVEKAREVLDKGRYFALVIGDKYSKGEWIPLGFMTMSEILKRGFSLKSIIVKNFEETAGKRNQKELWRYRALVGGFYIFKHEYVFLFRKER